MIEFDESLEKFYNEMYKPYLQTRDNAFLFCIAARKKYLKEDDECKLSNGADIIERKTIDKDNFNYFKHRLSNLYTSTYLDLNDNPIPDYAKVIYVQLNPVNLKSHFISLCPDEAIEEADGLVDITIEYSTLSSDFILSILKVALGVVLPCSYTSL